MGDGATAKALEIAAELAIKENAGSRHNVRPERVGEFAARILITMQDCLNNKEGS